MNYLICIYRKYFKRDILLFRYYDRIKKGKNCSKKDMQYILGYLATQVTVNNARRPGIFSNATIEEYNNREIAQKGKGNKYISIFKHLSHRGSKTQKFFFVISELVEIIHVKDHKTFTTHGSARCTLKEREAKAIRAYVEKVR